MSSQPMGSATAARLLRRIEHESEHARSQDDRVAALALLGRLLGMWQATPDEHLADLSLIRRLAGE